MMLMFSPGPCFRDCNNLACSAETFTGHILVPAKTAEGVADTPVNKTQRLPLDGARSETRGALIQPP